MKSSNGMNDIKNTAKGDFNYSLVGLACNLMIIRQKSKDTDFFLRAAMSQECDKCVISIRIDITNQHLIYWLRAT